MFVAWRCEHFCWRATLLSIIDQPVTFCYSWWLLTFSVVTADSDPAVMTTPEYQRCADDHPCLPVRGLLRLIITGLFIPLPTFRRTGVRVGDGDIDVCLLKRVAMFTSGDGHLL